jgi:hypothetical protein
VIDATVELLQSGAGVPLQKNGMRCGVPCAVSAESIVPLPLMNCGPGRTHGGGVSEEFTAAR